MLPLKKPPKEENNIRIEFKGNKLNISYITDKILAMSSPYNFSQEKFILIQTFFKEVLQDNITIISLCKEEEKIFNEKLFGDKIKYILIPFNDHETLSINSIHKTMKFIDNEINNNKKYVIIHCHRGKGRTGLIIACYLLYKNIFKESEEALNYFNKKRCIDNSCVKNPTQRKYMNYYQLFIKEKLYDVDYNFYIENLKLRIMNLKSILIEGIEDKNNLFCLIYEIESNKLLIHKEIIYGFNNFENDNIVLETDVKFYFIEKNNNENNNINILLKENENIFKLSTFVFAFNPYFEYNSKEKEIHFNSKYEINKIYKSKDKKYDNIKVILKYE